MLQLGFDGDQSLRSARFIELAGLKAFLHTEQSWPSPKPYQRGFRSNPEGRHDLQPTTWGGEVGPATGASMAKFGCFNVAASTSDRLALDVMITGWLGSALISFVAAWFHVF